MFEFERQPEVAPAPMADSPIKAPAIDLGSNQGRIDQLGLSGAGQPQNAQAAAVAAPANPFEERLTKEYQPLLAKLEGAKTDKERQEAALAVAGWNRANMVNQADVQAYLARPDVSMEEKTATMGQLAVAAARGEFLAGWGYEGGVNNGGANGWENNGKNSGAFTTHYQKQVNTAGLGDGQAWCTSFAGSAMMQAGFQLNKDVGTTTAKSPFWSGLRLDTWARNGQSIDGKQITGAGHKVVDAASGGKRIGAGKDNNGKATGWSKLDADLVADKKGEKRGDIASAFTAANGSPQAGDIMVLGENHGFRAKGASHTVMVESFDPETQTLTTIEGNKGDKVTSTKIDLRDPAQVSKIISSTRVGADAFMTEETRKKAAEKPSGVVDPNAITAEMLLGRAGRVNELLGGVAGRKGWIEDKDTAATAYKWMNGSGAGKDDNAGDR